MALHVFFISGPAKSGKTTLIRALARWLPRAPFCIRLALRPPNSRKRPSRKAFRARRSRQPLSFQRIDYDDDSLFEVLPEALTHIHKTDRKAFVIIETGSHATARIAYPYDYRIFVMNDPNREEDIFRSSEEAAAALRGTLDDSCAFLAELFLLGDKAKDSSIIYEGVSVHEGQSGATLEVSPSSLRGLLNSPLGAELATRIQLQPTYHGIVDCDLVVINTHVRSAAQNDACLNRLHEFVARVHDATTRGPRVLSLNVGSISDAESHPELFQIVQSWISSIEAT